ncbi:MAG: glycosyltransferase family 4 protein [Candidatus Heimdallarchaeaceae archaeon]
MEEHKLPEDSRDKWSALKEWPGLGRKLRMLVAPANKGGCSYYRAWNPFQKIEEQFPDLIEFRYNENPLEIDQEKKEEGTDGYKDINWADVVFTQNLSNFGGPATVRLLGLAKESGKFVWYDTDDLLTDIYDDHRLKQLYVDNDLENLTKFVYSNADLVTVTQQKFAARVAPFCTGTLAVIKNSIDYNLPAWNQPKRPSPRKNIIRIGWVGGIHHEADVKEFAAVPSMVNQRAGRERVHWGFYGRPPKELRPGIDRNAPEDWQQEVWDNYERTLLKGFRGAKNWDVYQALGPSEYGAMYSNIDIAIAPLQNNDFNDSKSDIKVAECGRYKVPLVASNVGCYSDTIINGETGYLISPDAPKGEWVRVLTHLIKNPKKIKYMGENLHSITEQLFDLNKVAYRRLDVLEFAMKKEKEGRDNALPVLPKE